MSFSMQIDGDKSRDGFAVTGDDDLIPRFNSIQQAQKLNLRFFNINGNHLSNIPIKARWWAKVDVR